MALPASISDIDFLQPLGRPEETGGNLYAIGRDASTTTDLKCIKSTDGGDTWSEVDAAGRPSIGGTILSIHSYFDGTSFHVNFSESGTNHYVDFDTSSDAWGTEESVSTLSGSDKNVYFAGIRSDGDLLEIHTGATKEMGTNYDRQYLKREEGAGWSSSDRIDGNGGVERHFRFGTAVTTSNDRTHIAYTDSGNGLQFSTYLSGNTFGHRDTTLDASASVTGQEAFIDVVQFDDGGTLKVRWLYEKSGDLYTVGFDGDADDPSGNVVGPFGPINTTANPDSAALVVTGTTQHVVFSVSAAQYHVTTGAGDDTWGSEDTIRSSGGGTIYSANIYDHGSGDVLAFLFTDSGAEEYDEVALAAGPITGTGDATVPAATVSATGERKVTGTASATVPAVTVSASGAREITGTGNPASPVPTVAATGTREITGTGNPTPSVPQVSASGTVKISGTGAANLPLPTVSAAGERSITGSGTATFPATAASGEGTATGTVTGTGTVNLPLPTLSGTGTRKITGSSALTLPAILAAAIGERKITGAVTIDLPAITAAASGTRTVTGVGTPALPVPSLSGSGTRIVTGQGSLNWPLPTVSAAGQREITGTGAPTMPAVTADGTGSVGNLITGTGAVTLPLPTVTALGTRTITGTVAITSPAILAAATGEITITGTGSVLLPAAQVDAVAEREITGPANITMPVPTVTAVGEVSGAVSGVADMNVPAATVAASGTRIITGTASVTLPVPTIDAADLAATLWRRSRHWRRSIYY